MNPLANPMASMSLGAPAKAPSKLPTKAVAATKSKIPASKVPVAKPAGAAEGAANPLAGGGGGNPLAGGGNPFLGGGNPLAAGAASSPAKAPAAKGVAKKVISKPAAAAPSAPAGGKGPFDVNSPPLPQADDDSSPPVSAEASPSASIERTDSNVGKAAAAGRTATPSLERADSSVGKTARAGTPQQATPSPGTASPVVPPIAVSNVSLAGPSSTEAAPAAAETPKFTEDEKKKLSNVINLFKKKPTAAAAAAASDAGDGKSQSTFSKFRGLMKGIVSGAISLPGSSSKDKPPSASEDATQSTGAAASAAPVQRAPSNEDFSRARSEASSAGVAMSPNDKDLPRPPIRGTSVASTAHTDATSEPPPSAPPSESASRREGSEAPVVALAAAPPTADSLTIKKMEAKHNASMRDLERRLIQAEGTISDMSRESKLLREQLFDRDGPKSVQHLVNLQREAMHLRVELDKERDSVAYHRTAHMQALEEVARLKKKFDTHGDHRALLEAKQTLLQQVADLIRSKTQLELRVSELEDSQLCLDKDEAQLNAAKRQGHVSSSLFVHCRRATLCDKCRDMISVLEQRLEFEASIRVNSFRQRDLVEDIVPPMLSQKWHRDPTSYVAPVVSGTVPGTHRSVPSAPETVYGQSPSWRGAKGWRMLRSLDGGIVYHNIITNQSTLERPAELYPDIF